LNKGILDQLVNQPNPPEFVMELTEKISSDVRVGGTISLMVYVQYNYMYSKMT